MDELQRLTAQLLQEREMRKEAERRSRAYSAANAKLKAKLAALARLKADPPAEGQRAGA